MLVLGLLRLVGRTGLSRDEEKKVRGKEKEPKRRMKEGKTEGWKEGKRDRNNS